MLIARAFDGSRQPQTTSAQFPPREGNTLKLQLSQRMKTDKKLSLVSCRALTTPAVPAAAPLRAAARTERWPPLHLYAAQAPERSLGGQLQDSKDLSLGEGSGNVNAGALLMRQH